MRVVADASSVVDVVTASEHREATLDALGRAGLVAAPELMPVEVVSALTAMSRADVLSSSRATAAVRTLAELPVQLVGHAGLIERTFSLSTRFSAYDAVYVALTEALGATLVTRDARMARQASTVVDVVLVEAVGPA
jgi:predicted nucleic acid-binding protein